MHIEGNTILLPKKAQAKTENKLEKEAAIMDKPLDTGKEHALSLSHNQCDGCRRDLKLKDGIHYNEDGTPYIGCTKDVYANTEGLIGPFKLRPADEAVERLSSRRRNFQEDDDLEVIQPFMRSMPYN